MLKWLLTLVVAIFLLGIIAPHLARFIRFGKLPGTASVAVLTWKSRHNPDQAALAPLLARSDEL